MNESSEVDCNILDSKFTCVEQRENIHFHDISVRSHGDALSIGVVKNDFENSFASISVASSNYKNSLDVSSLKEENKYSPGSPFVPSQDFYADVCTNRYDTAYFSFC